MSVNCLKTKVATLLDIFKASLVLTKAALQKIRQVTRANP